METDMLKDTRKHFSKLGLMVFFGALICYAVQLISAVLTSKMNPQLLENPNISLALSMIPLYALGMPAMAFLINRVPGNRIKKHDMSVGQWFIAFCMCYALMYLSNLIGIYATQIIGVLKGGSVENVMQELLLDMNLWAAVPFVVVLGPIVEELIFRKLLITKMVKYGEGTAIVVSAFLFALFHGNLNQFAYAMTLGLFWGFLFVKTGKVLYTILMHMLINFLGSVPGMLMMKSEIFQAISNPSGDMKELLMMISEHAVEVMAFFIYALFIIILFLTGIVLFAVNAKKMSLRPGEIMIPKGKRFVTLFVNVGMLLNILYWGIQIVLQLFD